MLLLASWSRGDTVTLVTGQSFNGKIAFDGKNTVTIKPKDAPPQRVLASELITLVIDPPGNHPDRPPPAIATLIDGTRVAAIQVLSLDDRELRLKRPDGGIFSVNPARVSDIDFDPSEPHPRPASQFVGAILAGKDVSEGDILSISPTAVKISSVLFGVQELDTAKTVKAVYLRPPGVSKSAYIVRCRDGSIWQATSLSLDAGKAVMATDLAGPVTLAAADIAAIDLGPAAADDLSALLTAANQPTQLTAGREQHLGIAGKYRAIVLTYRVPATYMPLRSARLIVLADDKQIVKTDLLTSIDHAVTITSSLQGVKQLTLKLEATGSERLGIAGQIEPGRLIRGGSH